MSIFNSILRGIGGAPDDVANLAAKVGIEPQMAERAIAALGQAHQEEGDTVELAAAKTGLDTNVLRQIVGHIGGEGSLSEFASMIDKDGDGSPFDDIANMAKRRVQKLKRCGESRVRTFRP